MAFLLTLEVRSTGESRKSARFMPAGMLKKDDGDMSEGESGREGGVRALYPDAPPAAAEPPSISVKLALPKEKEPGLELVDVSTLPDDEVVIGEGSDPKLRVCELRRATVVRPACTYGEGEEEEEAEGEGQIGRAHV